MLRVFISALLFWIVCVPSSVNAAVFYGEFWDATNQVRNLDDADAMIAAGDPTSTFTSTGIDYPNGLTNGTRVVRSSTTTLAAFLGTDAASIIGPTDRTLTRSVFRFTGYIEPSDTAQFYQVRSDDGFRLTIGQGPTGGVVTERFGQRGFATSTGVVAPNTGRVWFELIFFENGGRTGVEFLIDGATALPSAVPVPPALPLLGGALLGLGLLRRRRRAAYSH